MKRLLLTYVLLTAVTLLSAQSIEEIVKNFAIANKFDKISGYQTIKIMGKATMMGMEMPIVLYMKNPNKLRSVATIGGQEMIQVFDGEKGWVINPMTGSRTPVELGQEEISQMMRSSVFQNYLDNYLRNNMLKLEGTENVNGRPVFKIKATIEGGNVIRFFIDRNNYQLVKTVADVKQGGVPVSLESFFTDYTETNGFILPMTTTTSVAGMEFVYKYTDVKVNEPMDDSIFRLK
ncbi:MAG TPA: hypothetical protein PLS58_08260 [Bacteroidales bacterium]|jgi:outer membrane lipoprotein-sorting protein|nr:hypothetical protein [Bacteroidales bacterium]